MDAKHIAAQLYTLRDFTKTPEDVRKTLKKVSEMGYKSVQVSGMGPIKPEELKSIVDELNLKICATHTPLDRMKKKFLNVVKEHKLWDCAFVGLGAMPPEYRTSREGYKSFAKEFSGIARKFADNGLEFIYHNHKFEFEKFDGTTGMDILLNESDPETFGFEIDTYWVQAGGGDPVEWIKKVKGRMRVVHFKDMAIVNDQQVFAEVGEGNLNWRKIIDVCRETDVKWYAVEQDTCRQSPFTSLEMSLRNLEKLI